MPYVGNKPEVGNFRKCDAITTSATATYNLLVGGVAVNPNQNQCIVSLNGVIQSSGDSYTIASSQITFASALTSSDVIDFILILGDTLDVGVPSDDTCSQAKIQNEAINEAKMQISNAGTNGQYLQKQSGNTGGMTWADAGLTGWSTGGTQNSLIPSHTSQGIYLGVSSATASNLLDDYEEGEMASPIYIDNQQQTSYTSGRDKFSYIKIGRLVHCFGYVDTDGQTLVDTGTVELSLPFPVSANSSNVQNTGVAFLNGYLNNKYWTTHIYLNADDTKSELNYAVGSTAENSAYYEGGGFSVLNASHRLILTMSFTYNTDA